FLVSDDMWAYWSLAGSCTTDDACDTGHCDHGLCCEVSCGPCERCDDGGKGCSVIRSADDPTACTGDRTCDPAGGCRSKGGQACAHGSDCASGQCTGGVCCDAGCAPYACSSDGRCRTACEASDDCASGAECLDRACRAPTARCGDEHTSIASSGARQ